MMTKGKLLVLVRILLCWFASILPEAELLAQVDTLKLERIEIEECYAYMHTPNHVNLEFDSLEFASRMSRDAGEFLNYGSPVFIKDYGPGTTSTLSYRGNTANHTKVYWGNMAVDNAQLGLTDLSLMNFGDNIQASFMKGGYSLESGSGGFGGILHIDEKASWERFNLSAGINYGSFNTKSVPFELNLANKAKNLRFQSSSYMVESDNDFPFVNYRNGNQTELRSNARYRRVQWMPSLTYILKDRHAFKVSYWHLNSNREVPAAIGANAGGAKQFDLWNRLKTDYVFYFGNGSNNYVAFKNLLSEDFMRYENPSTSIFSENKIRSFKNLVETQYFIKGVWKGESQLRLDYQEVETVNYEDKEEMKLISLYQSIRYLNGRWLAKGLARIEKFDENEVVLLPSMNAGYQLSKRNQRKWVYTNFSYNMRYPTFNERFWLNAGNPDLQNESSITGEIALDHQLSNFKKRRYFTWRYVASIFYSEVQNLIYWSPDPSGVWIPQNVKAVNNSGLEIESIYTYRKKKWNLLWKVGYSYTNSVTIQDDDFPEFEGKKQVYVPANKVHTLIGIEVGKYFFHYQQNFTDRVYIDADNQTYLPHNMPARMDLGRSFVLGNSRLVTSFKINNAFNEEYQYVANMPMPLRNYTLSIIYQIN